MMVFISNRKLRVSAYSGHHQVLTTFLLYNIRNIIYIIVYYIYYITYYSILYITYYIIYKKVVNT